MVSPLAISALTEHFAHYALLWRPALSIPARTFRYVQEYCKQVRQLPEAAKDELRLMRDMAPFLYASCCRPAAPFVVAQDASGPLDCRSDGVAGNGAFCLAAAQPPLGEVEIVMRSLQTIGRTSLAPLGVKSPK